MSAVRWGWAGVAAVAVLYATHPFWLAVGLPGPTAAVVVVALTVGAGTCVVAGLLTASERRLKAEMQRVVRDEMVMRDDVPTVARRLRAVGSAVVVHPAAAVPPASASPANVVEMPSAETVAAMRRLARKVAQVTDD